MSNKDTIIEALTMQLKLEREGNIALVVWSKVDNPNEWESLDAFELKELYEQDPHWLNYAANIEAKLKEKNNG